MGKVTPAIPGTMEGIMGRFVDILSTSYPSFALFLHYITSWGGGARGRRFRPFPAQIWLQNFKPRQLIRLLKTSIVKAKKNFKHIFSIKHIQLSHAHLCPKTSFQTVHRCIFSYLDVLYFRYIFNTWNSDNRLLMIQFWSNQTRKSRH